MYIFVIWFKILVKLYNIPLPLKVSTQIKATILD